MSESDAAGLGRRGRADTATVRDVLAVLFFHRRIIILAVLLGLAAGVVASIAVPARYRAEGRVLVLISRDYVGDRPVTEGAAPVSIEGTRAVQAEMEILSSDEAIQAAIADVGRDRLFPRSWIARLPGLVGLGGAPDGQAPDGRAIAQFRRALRLDTEPTSAVIRILFEHRDAAMSAAAVNALIKGYLARRLAIFEDQRSALLQDQLHRFRSELETAEAELQSLRARYGIVDLKQQIDAALARHDRLQARRSEVDERRHAVQAELAAVQKQLGAVPTRVTDSFEETNGDSFDPVRADLMRLKVQRQQLASRFKEAYPPLQAIDREIAALQALIDRDGPRRTERTVRNPVGDQLRGQLESLQVERAGLEKQGEELVRQLSASEDQLTTLLEAQETLTAAQRRRDIADGIYRDFAARAEAVRVEEEAARRRAPNVRVVQQATVPPQANTLWLNFLAGGVMSGLFLGLAVVFIMTRVQQVFVVPADAERALGVPVLAAFGPDAPDAEGAATERRRLAGRLLGTGMRVEEPGERRGRVVYVLAAAPVVAASPVVMVLARELAEHFGQRVLLLDGGTARPRLAMPAPRPGEEATQEESGRIDLVPEGRPPVYRAVGPGTAAITDTSAPAAAVQATVRALAARFDVVLIDGAGGDMGPVAPRLAPVIDAAVLVLAAERTRAPVAASLLETLAGVGARVGGLVMVDRHFHIPRWIYRWL